MWSEFRFPSKRTKNSAEKKLSLRWDHRYSFIYGSDWVSPEIQKSSSCRKIFRKIFRCEMAKDGTAGDDVIPRALISRHQLWALPVCSFIVLTILFLFIFLNIFSCKLFYPLYFISCASFLFSLNFNNLCFSDFFLISFPDKYFKPPLFQQKNM